MSFQETVPSPIETLLENDPDFPPGLDVGPLSTPPDIRGKDDGTAVELMVEWFFENFDDPAEDTPWDEGHYVFIWGGPHYAREELEDAFSDVATEEALQDAVEQIEHRNIHWSPSSRRLQPEEPKDAVTAAKLRVLNTLLHWDDTRTSDADFNTAKATFRVSDIVVLLGALQGRRAPSESPTL
jgi:hypothetical protein